jgi:hypothetical protein
MFCQMAMLLERKLDTDVLNKNVLSIKTNVKNLFFTRKRYKWSQSNIDKQFLFFSLFA